MRFGKHFSPILCALTLAVLWIPSPASAQRPLTIFAAASTTNALTEIMKLHESRGGGKVSASFASSSTLAKQIENGAPADIFLSADQKWMDYLDQRKLIEPGSRGDLLGNRVVLIAPADSPLKAEIKPGFPLLQWLGEGRLSMGDPDHVPAGLYGKEALTRLGLWKQIEPRLARAGDVRAALALVERGECPLGVVYSTDAAISARVKVVAAFPADSHKPVVYPVGIVVGKASPAARAMLELLRSPQGMAIFKKYGFTATR